MSLLYLKHARCGKNKCLGRKFSFDSMTVNWELILLSGQPELCKAEKNMFLLSLLIITIMTNYEYIHLIES